jgi:hypothetical protein
MPTLVADDLVIVAVMSKNIVEATDEINVPTTASGTFTEAGTKTEVDSGTAADDMRTALYWKRAVAANSGANITVSRAGTDPLGLYAVVSVWRGVDWDAAGAPFDSVGIVIKGLATAGDIIGFDAINPVSSEQHVIYSGWKADDATNTLANFTTNGITFTILYGQESSIGSDCTHGIWSANHNGTALSAVNVDCIGTDGSYIGYAYALLTLPTITVVKTIGTTGKFSTPQLWEDGAPANLTTAQKNTAGTFAVAAFQQGESLTFAGSGATGKMLDTDSTGAGTGSYLTFGVSTGVPLPSDTVTGGTSGATCILSTKTGHGIIWEGQCQNQEFSGAGTQLTITGSTTNIACYKHITTVAGASFRDNANVQTNALRYNASNGCGFRTTGAGTTVVVIAEVNSRISKLQLASTGSSSPSLIIATLVFCEFLICEGTFTDIDPANGVVSVESSTLANCLIIQRASGADHIVGSSTFSPFFYNCTFVAADDLAVAPTKVLHSGTSGTVTTQNCAIFAGDSTKAIKAGSATYNFTTCYSDISGTTGVTQTTYANAFQNVNDATRDFRLKANSALINTGTTDATNAPIDIAGTARPSGAAYDVGCWEFVAAVAAVIKRIIHGQAIHRAANF